MLVVDHWTVAFVSRMSAAKSERTDRGPKTAFVDRLYNDLSAAVQASPPSGAGMCPECVPRSGERWRKRPMESAELYQCMTETGEVRHIGASRLVTVG